jgi:uncharacterized protein
MTEAKTQLEPSMDEILAGIRRIIVEDRSPIVENTSVIAETPVQDSDTKWIGEPTNIENGDTPANSEKTILAADVVDVIISKLNTLEEHILQQKPQESKTIDQIVIDMLRPAIKDWLDTNLPSMVESIVQCEIDRLVRVRTKL